MPGYSASLWQVCGFISYVQMGILSAYLEEKSNEISSQKLVMKKQRVVWTYFDGYSYR